MWTHKIVMSIWLGGAHGTNVNTFWKKKGKLPLKLFNFLYVQFFVFFFKLQQEFNNNRQVTFI